MATLTAPARARHAHTHVPGHIMDIGMDRKRRANGRPTYGKHGNGHVGARESQPVAIARSWVRAAKGSYPMGAHGIPAAHPVARRVIGASLGRRYNPFTCSTAAIQAGIRYRVIVGA